MPLVDHESQLQYKRQWRLKNPEKANAMEQRARANRKIKLIASPELKRITQDARNAYNRLWRKENNARARATDAVRRDLVRPQRILNQRKYYAENKVICDERGRQRARDCKAACVNMYSNGDACCAWCRNADMEILCLDHIDNDGNVDRTNNPFGNGVAFYRRLQKLDYPSGFQVLCYNCNIKKHREFVRATREGRPARIGTHIQAEC